MNEMSQRIEKYDNHITTELMRMNQTLTEQIINNSGGLKCGGTWGWRRVVYLDMTDPNTNCPSGWNMTGYSKRTCGRSSNSIHSCDSVFFLVSGEPYSQVCGRIRAYQYGAPDVFNGYNHDGQTTIDSTYVSGVAVMYDSPRQHIWTFANGAVENYTATVSQGSICSCDISGENRSHHLLEKITSVSLDMYILGFKTLQIYTNFTPMTLSGMGETVTAPVHVVLSTILHISPKPSARQLLMTWN